MSFLTSLASILAQLITIYTYIIWIRIILSWIFPYPSQGSFVYYFGAIVDPFLNLFRPKNRMMRIDFSPIFALGALSVVRAILYYFSATGRFTLGYILAAIVSAFWEYVVSLGFIFVFVILIVKFISLLINGNGLNQMGSMVDPLLRKIQTTFFKDRLVKQTTLTVIALLSTAVLYVGVRYLFALAINLCIRIPF